MSGDAHTKFMTTTDREISEIDIPNRKKESWKVFDQIAPTYDRINKILSMGVDILWRKHFRRNLPDQNGLTCIDLATGTADVAIELAKDTRVASVLGTDLSKEMIAYGKKKAERSDYSAKILLKIGDGVTIPEKDSSFDVLTVAFGTRNFPDYRTSLKNMVRVLKPGGRAMILEFSLPSRAIIRVPYLFYFRSVLPRIGNMMSRHTDAYTYLNRTVEDFPYGNEFVTEMQKAGFSSIESKVLSFGIATLYIGIK
jgi:demethylmenaquinone methyltransferase/2-methoxy-6-polyprenyl-1,4-benzoquinol methylase